MGCDPKLKGGELMKSLKKFLLCIPAFGLFLGGCSFAEIKDKVVDFFNGGSKKEEQKSGGEEQKGGEEGSKVNPMWPASDISTYLAGFEITDSVPGYTGEAKSITFSEQYGVMVELDAASKLEGALATYVADITGAGYVENGLDSYQDMTYLSPEGNLVLTPYTYDGTEDGDGFYLMVLLSAPEAPGEESTEFPLAKVQAELEYTESFPIPTGSLFEFSVDSQYIKSVFVTVHGGDLSAYLTQLEGAGFEIYDYIDDYQVAYAALDTFCLEISVTSNTEFKINYFIGSDSN